MKSQPQLTPKNRQVLYPEHSNAEGMAAWIAAFSSLFMKKFLVFFLFLLLLIVSEYFLLNELLSHKRVTVLLMSLVGTVLCIYAVTKFFKKYILPAKQSEAHS